MSRNNEHEKNAGDLKMSMTFSLSVDSYTLKTNESFTKMLLSELNGSG